MIIIGITGEVASGKTTIANIFKEKKYKVFNADEEVHKLFVNDLDLKVNIKEHFPTTYINDEIDKKILGDIVFNDELERKKLENIIHPKIHQKLLDFISQSKNNNEDIIILDIPLLYEVEDDKLCDYVIVTKLDEDIQKIRFEKRAGGAFKNIKKIKKAKSIKIEEKIKRANFVIDTKYDIELLKKQVEDIIEKIGTKK